MQIIDRPGALNSLTQVFSDLGVNILQVYHQRSMAQCHFGEAMVDIEIETRGPEHTATVIQKLLNQGFNVKQKTF